MFLLALIQKAHFAGSFTSKNKFFLTKLITSVHFPKSWLYVKGVELFLEKSFDNGRLVVDSNGDMIIKKATFEDQGLYKCQASSSLGSVTADIQLVIKCKLIAEFSLGIFFFVKYIKLETFCMSNFKQLALPYYTS